MKDAEQGKDAVTKAELARLNKKVQKEIDKFTKRKAAKPKTRGGATKAKGAKGLPRGGKGSGKGRSGMMTRSRSKQ